MKKNLKLIIFIGLTTVSAIVTQAMEPEKPTKKIKIEEGYCKGYGPNQFALDFLPGIFRQGKPFKNIIDDLISAPHYKKYIEENITTKNRKYSYILSKFDEYIENGNPSFYEWLISLPRELIFSANKNLIYDELVSFLKKNPTYSDISQLDLASQLIPKIIERLQTIPNFYEKVLLYAADTGNFDLTKYLIEKINVKIPGDILHKASQSGNLDLIKYLITQDFNFTKKISGNSPLECFIKTEFQNLDFKDREQIIKLLIWQQNLAEKEDIEDALLSAIYNENKDNVHLLLKYSPYKTLFAEEDSIDPLFFAIESMLESAPTNNFFEIINLLLEQGFDINTVNDEMDTLLTYIVISLINPDFPEASFLLDQSKPLDYLKDFNKIINLLINKGIFLNAKNNEGATALDLIKQNINSLEVVEQSFLLSIKEAIENNLKNEG